MKFWKDKQGKELSYGEFKERWKKGIEEVTPVQSLETSIFFQQIMTLGFFAGLCVSLYNWKTTWWLALILFGGLGMNISQLRGLKRQYKTLKKIEDTFRDDKKDSD